MTPEGLVNVLPQLTWLWQVSSTLDLHCVCVCKCKMVTCIVHVFWWVTLIYNGLSRHVNTVNATPDSSIYHIEVSCKGTKMGYCTEPAYWPIGYKCEYVHLHMQKRALKHTKIGVSWLLVSPAE